LIVGTEVLLRVIREMLDRGGTGGQCLMAREIGAVKERFCTTNGIRVDFCTSDEV